MELYHHDGGLDGDRRLSRCLPNTSTFVPNDHYRTSSELENHVTNVTTVLNEITASDRVSRSEHSRNLDSDLFWAGVCCFVLLVTVDSGDFPPSCVLMPREQTQACQFLNCTQKLHFLRRIF